MKLNVGKSDSCPGKEEPLAEVQAGGCQQIYSSGEPGNPQLILVDSELNLSLWCTSCTTCLWEYSTQIEE